MAQEGAGSDPCKDSLFYSSCKADLQYAQQHLAWDLPPPPRPPYGALAAIIALLVLVGLIVARWASIRLQIERWLIRPLTRKTTRNASALRRWWLEE